MPPWFKHILLYQEKESYLKSSRFVQLATVGLDNTPRVRTVVFRGWSKSFQMKIFTDKRSFKISELELNNNLEICWLFLKSKCQFRFRGRSIIDKSDDRLNHWNEIDENTKSMWSWPIPGGKYLIRRNVKSIPVNDSLRADNFVLLKINISHVDQLLLKETSHFRRQWRKENNWAEERINP